MRISFSYSFKRLSFFCFVFLHLSSNRREVTVKVISLQFLTCPKNSKQATWRRSACSKAARNPREITISLAFVCREPSCIQKHNSPLRFFFQLYCTSVCIQRGPLDLSPPGIHPANEVFMTQDLSFWYATPILFNSSQAGVSAVMSKFKKWGRETKSECSCRERRSLSFHRPSCHTY